MKGLVFETPEERAHYNRALARFVSKCEYNEMTGCVLWTAAPHHYRDGEPWYGGFHFEGSKWLAHRWAALFIHGLNLSGGLTVGHCCPGWPNNKCVHHLEPQTYQEQNAEMNYRKLRKQRGLLTNIEKRYWLGVVKGFEEPLEPLENGMAVPYPDPPEWFRSAKE